MTEEPELLFRPNPGGGSENEGDGGAGIQPAPAAPEAPEQSEEEMSLLIRKIQHIRSILGSDVSFDIPTIAVIGDQSSGKTSTLEVIGHLKNCRFNSFSQYYTFCLFLVYNQPRFPSPR